MKDKTQRQLAIRKIISSGRIGSQEKLLLMLREQGYHLTQATLSRDLKLMQVAKASDGADGYMYVIPETRIEASGRVRNERNNFLADGFRDLRFTGNLAVIRTLPGYASSIASVIDRDDPWEILGTIAGDDTILVILREGITRSDLQETLIRIMPYLKNKIHGKI